MTDDALNPHHAAARLVVVMGAAGSGKSTIGALLAARLSLPFVDADSLHSADSIAKMARGEPLDDEDRWPWLDRVADQLAVGRAAGGVVVACSALKAAYRDAIRRDGDEVLFAHLAPSADVLAERLAARTGHFMPPSLLHSQLAALEELGPGEWGIRIDAAVPPEQIAATIEHELR